MGKLQDGQMLDRKLRLLYDYIVSIQGEKKYD